MKKYLAALGLSLLVNFGISHASAQDVRPETIRQIPAEQLKWSYDGTRDKLLAESRKFLGNAHGNFVATNGQDPSLDYSLASEQFVQVFSGIPEGAERFEDGSNLFAATEQHNADVKAMIVTTADQSSIVAAALLHRNCGKNNPRGPNNIGKKNQNKGCDRDTTLTIFVPAGKSLGDIPRGRLIAWVRNEEKIRNRMLNSPRLAIKNFKVDVQKVQPNQ